MPVKYERMMSLWQRDLLEKRLAEIDNIIQHRKWVTSLYETLLGEKGVETVRLTSDYDPVFLRYPIFVENKIRIIEEAKKRHLEIGDWFLSPIHPNLSGWEKAGYEEGTCCVAEEVCKHTINLPTHCGIQEKYAKKIVEFIVEAIEI